MAWRFKYKPSDLTLQCPGEQTSCPALALIELSVCSCPGSEELFLIKLLLDIVVDPIGLVVIQAFVGTIVATKGAMVSFYGQRLHVTCFHSLHHVVAQEVLSLSLLLVVPYDIIIPVIVAGLLEAVELIDIVSVVL